MEPRPNHSQNDIVRRCVRCNSLGRIGWYMRRRGWRNGKQFPDRDVDGWSGLCDTCRLIDLIVVWKVRDMVEDGHDRWEDDGGRAWDRSASPRRFADI